MNHRTTTIHTHSLNLPPRSSIRTYQILITYSLDRLHDLYFVLSSIISSVLFFDLSTSASHTYLSFCLTNYLYTTPYSTIHYRQPTSRPSKPSGQPSRRPSRVPTQQPTRQPSRQPSSQPTMEPTNQPSSQPTKQPFSRPSHEPTHQPTSQPSRQPFMRPTMQPSAQPVSHPTMEPSNQPTMQPSKQPSSQPSRHPSKFISWSPSMPTNAPISKVPNVPFVDFTLRPLKNRFLKVFLMYFNPKFDPDLSFIFFYHPSFVVVLETFVCSYIYSHGSTAKTIGKFDNGFNNDCE